MAYFNANPALEPVTRIFCDGCAKTEVPFRTEYDTDGAPMLFQEKPWRWAPRYGAPCHACGSEC